MKEHRVRTRVTTPSSIASREHADQDDADVDSLWGCGMQLLRLELQLGLEDVKAARPHQPPPPADTPHPCSSPSPGPASSPATASLTPGQDPGRTPDPSPAALGRKERCNPCSSCAQRRRGVSPLRRVSYASQKRLSAQQQDQHEQQEQQEQPLLRLLAGDLEGPWEDVLATVELLLESDASKAGSQRDRVRVWSCGRLRARARVRWCDGEGPGPVEAEVLAEWLRGRDAGGHTPLLLGGRRLLAAGRWQDAAHLASRLLAAGADPNAVNREGRSLLSYAVAALDDGLDTTRLLLNYGASVWSRGDAMDGSRTRTHGCADSPSVFTYFLRAVIRRRRLDDGCMRTLFLLSQEMSERPRLMHSLVLRTMFRHSRCYRVLGPVFLQIKTAMARYWSGPQELRSLCRRAIRRALGARLHSGARALGLPAPLAEYLLLNS